MTLRVSLWSFIFVLVVSGGALSAQTAARTAAKNVPQGAMDRDLLEVTVPQLEEMYRTHKYTVTQVVQWYMARVARYNGIYRAVQNLDLQGALDTAAREDAEAVAAARRQYGLQGRPGCAQALHRGRRHAAFGDLRLCARAARAQVPGHLTGPQEVLPPTSPGQRDGLVGALPAV